MAVNRFCPVHSTTPCDSISHQSCMLGLSGIHTRFSFEAGYLCPPPLPKVVIIGGMYRQAVDAVPVALSGC